MEVQNRNSKSGTNPLVLLSASFPVPEKDNKTGHGNIGNDKLTQVYISKEIIAMKIIIRFSRAILAMTSINIYLTLPTSIT